MVPSRNSVDFGATSGECGNWFSILTPGTAESFSTTKRLLKRRSSFSNHKVTLRAFILDSYKTKDGGRIGEMPEPELREEDVLVQIHAAGVNVLDSKIAAGEFKLILPYRPEMPFVHYPGSGPQIVSTMLWRTSDRQSNVAFQNLLLEARPLTGLPEFGDVCDAVA